MSTAPILIVPGLRDEMPDHWQSHFARERPECVTVPRIHGSNLPLQPWVDLIDAAIAAMPAPPILVAHSAGVMMVVHWAKQRARAIRGALLATPPDFESPLPKGYPAMDVLHRNGWLPTPRARLPFPTLVAASETDPLAAFERAEEMARDWGSAFVNLGRVGHLNPMSGFGPWPRVHELVRSLEHTTAAA
jgi:predicted alpha/beta hydrolase family esterase